MQSGVTKRDVLYRGPVEMSGWVQKYQSRIRTRQVRRYFKLNNSQLSSHPNLTSPASWEVSVSKCIVKSNEQTCVVSVRLLDHEIRFQVATAEQTRCWHSAIRFGAECNIKDFYKIGKELGFGSFGAVRLAFDLNTGEKRAVKIVKRTSNAKELEFVQREINVLLSISHKHIVRTHNIFDERQKIFLVMDYIAGGDLFDYMAKRGKLAELSAKVIIWQMLKGLAYLHSKNIVHRDIKPENVLMTCDNPVSIQLTDFGLANFIDPSSNAPATDMKSLMLEVMVSLSICLLQALYCTVCLLESFRSAESTRKSAMSRR
jgi:serine/threonine protein kinase